MDIYFVSGLGKGAVAAVSVAFPIQLIFLGIGLTFGAGAGSYISRLLGGNNKKEASIVATVALMSSAILGIITAIATLIARVITSLMYLSYFVGDKNLIEIQLPNFKPTVAIYKEKLKIGISMLILQILQTISISRISDAASFLALDYDGHFAENNIGI